MLFIDDSIGTYSFATDTRGSIPCRGTANNEHFLLLFAQLQLILFVGAFLSETGCLHQWLSWHLGVG